MVTEEEWEQFCKELPLQETIYDLLVLLYTLIEGENHLRYIKEYHETLSNLPDGYWGDLSLITNEMLSECITFKSYLKRLSGCMQKEKLRNMAIRLIRDFDVYLKEKNGYPALGLKPTGFTSEVFLLGPLNMVNPGYCFYLMPDCHYFKDINKQSSNKIRFLDHSVFTSLNGLTKNYKIIKKNCLEKQVKIKYYTGTQQISATYPEIKIGIVPVSKKLWCKPCFMEYAQKNYFGLEDEQMYCDGINEAYIDILKHCMDNHIQIVIFPELARNKKTLTAIQDFLTESACCGNNSLELIFLGSLWENGNNEGILLSGTGTLLITSKKINPFSLKENGKIYWEDLKKQAQEIELIDIPKIGRIQYLICKDGLNDGWLHNLWGLFETAFSVISSYSDSVSYFETLSSSFSTQYGGIQILANACAPRINLKGSQPLPVEIGHISMPCSKNEKRGASSHKEAYSSIVNCKKCRFAECIRVFELNPILPPGNRQFYEILMKHRQISKTDVK